MRRWSILRAGINGQPFQSVMTSSHFFGFYRRWQELETRRGQQGQKRTGCLGLGIEYMAAVKGFFCASRNYWAQFSNNKAKEAGLAVLEAAVCMVVGVPLLTAAVGTMVLLYDQNAIRVAPVEGLRGVAIPALHYQSTRQGARFEMDSSVTGRIVPTVASQVLNHAVREGIAIRNIGVRSCAWLYRVDTSTGRAIEMLQQDCINQGAQAGTISFDSELRKVVSEPIGLPLRGGDAGYLEVVVLLGAKIEADFNAILFSNRDGFGVVEVPRQEVSL